MSRQLIPGSVDGYVDQYSWKRLHSSLADQTLDEVYVRCLRSNRQRDRLARST